MLLFDWKTGTRIVEDVDVFIRLFLRHEHIKDHCSNGRARFIFPPSEEQASIATGMET